MGLFLEFHMVHSPTEKKLMFKSLIFSVCILPLVWHPKTKEPVFVLKKQLQIWKDDAEEKTTHVIEVVHQFMKLIKASKTLPDMIIGFNITYKIHKLYDEFKSAKHILGLNMLENELKFFEFLLENVVELGIGHKRFEHLISFVMPQQKLNSNELKQARRRLVFLQHIYETGVTLGHYINKNDRKQIDNGGSKYRQQKEIFIQDSGSKDAIPDWKIDAARTSPNAKSEKQLGSKFVLAKQTGQTQPCAERTLKSGLYEQLNSCIIQLMFENPKLLKDILDSNLDFSIGLFQHVTRNKHTIQEFLLHSPRVLSALHAFVAQEMEARNNTEN